jgi:RNA methyltransferase, TrmH family
LAYRHRLRTRRSAREAETAFVVEGTKLLSEALDAGAAIESVYLDPGAAGNVDALVERCLSRGLRVYELEAGILARVADTVTPQPILAVVSTVDVSLDDLRLEKSSIDERPVPGGDTAPLVVVCVDVRDPGNAGSVLRSAEAAGVDAVVFCEGSVDLYNPKTVRASAGALFHVPVVVGGSPVAVLDRVGQAGLRRLGTVARGGDDYTTVDLRGPTAVILGNEANGLPDEIEGRLDAALSIPMAGKAESLNVGIAAAVVCFEAARQRRAASPISADGCHTNLKD